MGLQQNTTPPAQSHKDGRSHITHLLAASDQSVRLTTKMPMKYHQLNLMRRFMKRREPRCLCSDELQHFGSSLLA